MIKNRLIIELFLLSTLFIHSCTNNNINKIHLAKMTYIITVRTPNSILMSSDTRLNYFNDVELDGVRYQRVIAIADCIRKTFYITSAQVGINFLGIGYFEDKELGNTNKYPLSHFIHKLNSHKIDGNIKAKFQYIFKYFVSISESHNTGQYVKGVMTGYKRGVSYVCTFNTYDNTFDYGELPIGSFVDSENNKNLFPRNRQNIIKEIDKRIKQKSIERPYYIGDDIEIMELLPNGTFKYIQESNHIFNGTHQELVNNFNTDIDKINGKLINPPILQKYDF